MSHPQMKKIYNSTRWQNCREYIFNKYFGLCADCGSPGLEVHHIKHLTLTNIDDPNIVYGEDNLVLLCRACHFKRHGKREMREVKPKKSKMRKGLYFDAEGNMCVMKKYIVHGAPGSGKSTYIRRHKEPGDLIVDLDLIFQAISLEDKADLPINLLDTALYVRECLYQSIESMEVDSKTVWIAATLPDRDEREELKKRLGAELIHIDTAEEECIYQAMNDPERKDFELQKKIIRKYFSKYK